MQQRGPTKCSLGVKIAGKSEEKMKKGNDGKKRGKYTNGKDAHTVPNGDWKVGRFVCLKYRSNHAVLCGTVVVRNKAKLNK